MEQCHCKETTLAESVLQQESVEAGSGHEDSCLGMYGDIRVQYTDSTWMPH
jgi:hypothetical protein